jgi:rhamnosyltransferase subunit B
MASVLIGWELGAGRGHLVSMRLMAEALVARGHKVTLAAQRLDVGVTMPPSVAMVQAPVWPGLLSSVGAGQGRVATIADVLARVGLGRQGVLAGVIAGWEGLIATTGADAVIADYAPGLLMAARGRLPSVSTGPGFQVTPADADPLPRLGGGEPGHDEAALLDTIDAELRSAGRDPLPRLAALFTTDAPLIASFPELDPYRRDGSNARFIAPGLDGVPQPGAGQGDEVFVYANSVLQTNEPFWRALAATRLPVRAHVPGIDTRLRTAIAALGIKVEPRPEPMDRIVARSRLNINHGAHGIICAMLLGGVPQIMLPLDLEKRLHSEAVARIGLGLMPTANEDAIPQLADLIRSAYDDVAMAQRARDAAPAFSARMAVPYGAAISGAVEALV